MGPIAFDWWPGGLAWLLVLELLLLGVMLVYRWIARLLGKGDPRDFFVIFHRTFWRALQNPKLYPLPVNYEPVPPRKRERPSIDRPAEGEGQLEADEIERLLAGDADEAPPSAAGAYEVPEPAAIDDASDAGTGTTASEMAVRVVGPSEAEVVRGFDDVDGALVVAVTVAPDDGRANAAAIGVVARVLHLQTHQVTITAGHTRPDKTLRLNGLAPADLAARRADLEAAAVPEPPKSDADRIRQDIDEDDILFKD